MPAQPSTLQGGTETLELRAALPVSRLHSERRGHQEGTIVRRAAWSAPGDICVVLFSSLGEVQPLDVGSDSREGTSDADLLIPSQGWRCHLKVLIR